MTKPSCKVTFDNIDQVACQYKQVEKYMLFKSQTYLQITLARQLYVTVSAVALIPHLIVLIG